MSGYSSSDSDFFTDSDISSPRLSFDELSGMRIDINRTISSRRLSFDELSGMRMDIDRMRMDIDRMTYEELLELGERVGYISTGIPEGSIPICLASKLCTLLDQNQAKSCPICLEAFQINEELGTINRCGHEYHASCIRRWLLMKNFCPICKRAALDPPANN